LLPEFYPIKPVGAFIAADFIAGCKFDCSFCISKRHPSREALFRRKWIISNEVTPGKMHQWLKQMPSFQAGVQLRIGHDTDAGLQFEKSAELIELIDPNHSITYLTRKPFNAEETGFFGTYRENLLMKLTATPKSRSLGVHRDPLRLVRSAERVDPRMLYWVVGPLVADNYEDCVKILEALPEGSSLFLKELNYAGLPHLGGVPPLSGDNYSRLEDFALKRGHIITEWFCKSGLARIGRGFFDVDKLTQQYHAAKKERELEYCRNCGSNSACHSELDLTRFNEQLAKNLKFLGLTLLQPPKRTGARSFEIKVDEPSSRGEETFLNHVMDQPVSININTREEGRSQGGSFCNVDRRVLKRWYESGFLPVTELNVVAENLLREMPGLAQQFPEEKEPAGKAQCG
jgi:hypothetical protein